MDFQPPRFPGPVVARRYASTGTGAARKAAVDVAARAARVQQWTANKGPRGVSGGHTGAAAERGQS
jgi:hypothetical protein